MYKMRVLVVDDLPDVRTTLSGLLSDEGYDVRSASSRAEALRIMKDVERFHVAVLDVRLDESDEENRDGLSLMHDIKAQYPAVAVIILTGYADVKMVREALQPNQEGVSPAFGFLEKSEVDRLIEYVNRACERTVFDLIAQGENEQIEFKSSLRWDYNTNTVNKVLQEVIASTIAGMLNSHGGVLLVGVGDDGTILGIEKDLQTLRKQDTDGFQLALLDIIQTYLGKEYVTCAHSDFYSIDGKCISIVAVDKSPSPVFFAAKDGHKFWVRIGNSTRSLDVKETMAYIQTHWGKEG